MGKMSYLSEEIGLNERKKNNKVLKAEKRLLKNKVFEMESELKNNKLENIGLRKELLLEKKTVKDLFAELIRVCKLLDEKRAKY